MSKIISLKKISQKTRQNTLWAWCICKR